MLRAVHGRDQPLHPLQHRGRDVTPMRGAMTSLYHCLAPGAQGGSRSIPHPRCGPQGLSVGLFPGIPPPQLLQW